MKGKPYVTGLVALTLLLDAANVTGLAVALTLDASLGERIFLTSPSIECPDCRRCPLANVIPNAAPQER